MRTRLTIILTLLAAALALPSAASAATTFGDPCIADDDSEPGGEYAIFNISAPGNPLPVAAPADGVITSWSVPLISPYPEPVEQVLKVIRPLAPGQIRLVGEAVGTIQGSSNVFAARIPVKAGDRLGLAGRPGGFVFGCEVEPEEAILGGYEDEPPVPVGGSAVMVEETAPFRIPVSAMLEPDADGDGFGDETQDRCPQSAAVQATCPVVVPTPAGAPIVLDSLALPGKNKVLVYVATSATTPVTVSGTAKLPGAKRANGATKRKAKAATRAKLRPVTRTVTPGTLARFTLPLTAQVKRYLKVLPHGKKLVLDLTASAGKATDTTKLRLPGAKKSARRGKR